MVVSEDKNSVNILRVKSILIAFGRSEINILHFLKAPGTSQVRRITGPWKTSKPSQPLTKGWDISSLLFSYR